MAVTNSIQIAELFTKLIDEKYHSTALSAVFESNIVEIGSNYGKFHIMKVDTDGIGTYDRQAGYPTGAVTLEWEEVSGDIDLGARIVIDYYENEEALAKAFSKASEDIVRKLIDEIDAIRFAKISQIAATKVAEDLVDGEAVVKSLRTGINSMDNENVYDDKYLLATPEVLGYLEDMDSYKSKAILGNFVGTIKVPHKKFYTSVDVQTGRGDSPKFNYTKTDGAKDINFMIVSKASVIAKTETRIKVNENPENFDGLMFSIREAGLSAYGLENKVAGIYVSHTTV